MEQLGQVINIIKILFNHDKTLFADNVYYKEVDWNFEITFTPSQ